MFDIALTLEVPCIELLQSLGSLKFHKFKNSDLQCETFLFQFEFQLEFFLQIQQRKKSKLFVNFWSLIFPELLITLCKNCPNAEFFWSVFSRIATEILCKYPSSVRKWKNADQKNSLFRYFSCSVNLWNHYVYLNNTDLKIITDFINICLILAFSKAQAAFVAFFRCKTP